MRILFLGFISFALSFSSCSEDSIDAEEEEVPGVEETIKYIIGADAEESSYLVVADSLTGGNISIVGNGIESASHGDITWAKDGYVYFMNNSELTIDQFILDDDGGMTQLTSVSYDAIVPGASFRYIQVTDDDYLMLLSTVEMYEDGVASSPFVVLKVPEMTVENYGFFDIPQLAGDTATWLNGKVLDDKIYLGMMYGDHWGFDNLPDSLVTLIYDFPSFDNPKMIISDKTAGSASGYRANSTFIDENDHIYQYNLNATVWTGSNTNHDLPSGFVRIIGEEYDDDYFFNVSDYFDEDIVIWSAWYAGNGIAYANVVKDSDITEWRGWTGDYSMLCMVDLWNNTLTKLNVPSANLVDIFQLEAADEDYFYIPICPTDGDAYIYQIEIGGGANDFTTGASLDGANVFINSLVKTEI